MPLVGVPQVGLATPSPYLPVLNLALATFPLQLSGSRRRGKRVPPLQAAALRRSSSLPRRTGKRSSSGVHALPPAAGGWL